MKVQPHTCPTCAKLLDAATAIDGEGNSPRTGDLSVCLYCGEIIEFGDDMELIKADIDSIVQADFLELQKAQKLVRAWSER